MRRWELKLTGTDGEYHHFELHGDTVLSALKPVLDAWQHSKNQDYYGYFFKDVMNIELIEMYQPSEDEQLMRDEDERIYTKEDEQLQRESDERDTFNERLDHLKDNLYDQ